VLSKKKTYSTWLPVVTTGASSILEMVEPNRVPDDDRSAFALGDKLRKCMTVTTDP
jgi:hypothetical protein